MATAQRSGHETLACPRNTRSRAPRCSDAIFRYFGTGYPSGNKSDSRVITSDEEDMSYTESVRLSVCQEPHMETTDRIFRENFTRDE